MPIKESQYHLKNPNTEIKINKFERWRKVVGIRPRHELPSEVGRKVIYFKEQLILEDEIAVSPENKNIEIRSLKRRR